MNQQREKITDLGRVHRCIRPFLSKMAAFKKTMETSPAALAELQVPVRPINAPRITKQYHRKRQQPISKASKDAKKRDEHGVILSSTEEFNASKAKMSSPLLASAYSGIFHTYCSILRQLAYCRGSKGRGGFASRCAFGVGICISQTADDVSPDEWLQAPACLSYFEDIIEGWILNELCTLAPLLKKALIPFLLCAVEQGMMRTAAALAEAFYDAFRGQWHLKDFFRAKQLATVCCLHDTFPQRLRHELSPSSLQSPMIADLAVASGLLEVSIRIVRSDEETVELLVKSAIKRSLEGNSCGNLLGAASSISRTPRLQKYHSILLLRCSEVNSKVEIAQIPTTEELAGLVVSIWPFEELKQLVTHCSRLNARLALSIAMSLTAQDSSKEAISWALRVQERGIGKANWRYEDLLGEWVDKTPARPIILQRERLLYKKKLSHKISKLRKPSKRDSIECGSRHGHIQDHIFGLSTARKGRPFSELAVLNCNVGLAPETIFDRGDTDELCML